jgi:hypothetical protein
MLTIRHNRASTVVNTVKNVSIDEFLNQPIDRVKPKVIAESIRSIVERICKKNGCYPDDVMGKSRRSNVCDARFQIMQELHFKHHYHPSRLAYMFNLDLTSVKHMIGMRKHSPIKYEVLRKMYA